jgi:anti-anti-sigma factor
MARHNPHMTFQADCVRHADQVMLRFSGRLMVDPEDGPPGWTDCVDRAASPVVSIDLGGVTGIDASGLGLLAEVARAVRGQGRRLSLIAANPRVRRLLALTRLDTLVEGGVGAANGPKLAA